MKHKLAKANKIDMDNDNVDNLEQGEDDMELSEEGTESEVEYRRGLRRRVKRKLSFDSKNN